jgi:ornithine cyclodeaminase/alanine dehydrogenase-like protein (mu-crystallin family)
VSAPPGQLRYFSRGDVEGLGISGLKVLELMKGAFAAKGRGMVEMPPKIGLHPRPDAFLHAMPAYRKDDDVASLKWVSGYPSNADEPHDVPYLHGLVVLSDAATGRPTAVMDATWITEVRTAAVSVLGISALLSAEPSSVGIVGCGRQGRVHLELIAAALPSVKVALLYDPAAEAAHDLAEAMGDRFSCRFAGLDELGGADIVVSSAPIAVDPARPLARSGIKQDAVVCAVDFDATLDADVPAGASVFVVDDLPQYEYYREQGYFKGYPSDPLELSNVLTAERDWPPGLRVYAPLGIALADLAVAAHIEAVATTANVGVLLPTWARSA